MTAATYTDTEREALERVGRRRTVEALVDLRQRHLSEFAAGRDLSGRAPGEQSRCS